VGDRFALGEFDPLRLEGSLVAADGTGDAAVGARLLVAEGGGVTVEEGLEGALGEALSGRVGDLFHRGEVDVESGSVVAEGASGDDFPPLGGQLAEFEEFVGGEGTACHDVSCQRVPANRTEEFPPTIYGRELATAKLFMTSIS